MFNKKENKHFRDEIDNLWIVVNGHGDKLYNLKNKKEWHDMGEAYPEVSLEFQMQKAIKAIKAIIDYLGIEMKLEYEKDSAYREPVMRKVYKAYKIKKKIKKINKS